MVNNYSNFISEGLIGKSKDSFYKRIEDIANIEKREDRYLELNDIFYMLCETNNAVAVKTILEHDKLGDIANIDFGLMVATVKGNYEVVNELIKVRRLDKGGIVKRALEYNHYDIVKLMLSDERIYSSLNREEIDILKKEGFIND